MNIQRCRIAGLVALFALAILMFARSASALDGRVHAEPHLAIAPLHYDGIEHLLATDYAGLPGVEWMTRRAPWTRALLTPMLRPLSFLHFESISALGGSPAAMRAHPDASKLPPHLLDRILALPIRPVQIGESRRIPMDPKPGAGLVLKLSF
jgi:hypothetical protein